MIQSLGELLMGGLIGLFYFHGLGHENVMTVGADLDGLLGVLSLPGGPFRDMMKTKEPKKGVRKTYMYIRDKQNLCRSTYIDEIHDDRPNVSLLGTPESLHRQERTPSFE